ncbi:DUF3120 domain-containing protein [Synechococcales cyanobacterium C]|uniref:DUF3120 domain-containing protein n=1 Tax=Petrachloros mirabilis ULC683 TaxID=2781853 RepID=A0A8K2A717_9CYAN|nr:DUF3120 domain-containing protein [Petrachloros mirabilis]NCJ06499.1 DUF3120 domain-containing protein [Petrachloros mirabilis ULC683]
MQVAKSSVPVLVGKIGTLRSWRFFSAAIFLVSVPVFIQAPLVRAWPWIGLLSTGLWLGTGWVLQKRPASANWGSLILGFTLTWIAGSLYWGWLRWEPLLHLPVEALAVPLVPLLLRIRAARLGIFFYLGSLLGTAITDLYFYIVGLIPYWRQLMQVEPDLALPILQDALGVMQTPWGQAWALILILVLLFLSCAPLVQRGVLIGASSHFHWWVFSGAVVSTLLVDGLFWLSATQL